MELPDLQYNWFKQSFHKLSGIDLNGYRDAQMKRRIKSFLISMGVGNFTELYKVLENDKKILENFKIYLTINVSYFFRDTEKWDEFRNKYLPLLLEKNKMLKIWSAGCSIGCEPYTLSILLEEYNKKCIFNYSILASDIDVQAVNLAKAGVYNAETLKYLKGSFVLQEYFAKEESGNFKINDKARKNITFQINNLLSGDLTKANFDFILCRNVVIYFDESAKAKLYKKFYNALNNKGILFTGGSEIIFNCETLGFKNLAMCFYQKV